MTTCQPFLQFFFRNIILILLLQTRTQEIHTYVYIHGTGNASFLLYFRSRRICVFAPPLPPPPPPPLHCTQSLLSAGVHHFISVPLPPPLLPFLQEEEWRKKYVTLFFLSLDYLYGKTSPDVSIFFPLRKEKENCCFCIPAATSSDPFRTGSVVKSSSATCYVDEFCRLSVVIQLARKTLRNPINLDSFLIFLFRRCRVSSSLYCSIEFHFWTKVAAYVDDFAGGRPLKKPATGIRKNKKFRERGTGGVGRRRLRVWNRGRAGEFDDGGCLSFVDWVAIRAARKIIIACGFFSTARGWWRSREKRSRHRKRGRKKP